VTPSRGSLVIAWLAAWALTRVMRRLRAAGAALRRAALPPFRLGVARDRVRPLTQRLDLL
jgi:hypothetical protein